MGSTLSRCLDYNQTPWCVLKILYNLTTSYSFSSFPTPPLDSRLQQIGRTFRLGSTVLDARLQSFLSSWKSARVTESTIRTTYVEAQGA